MSVVDGFVDSTTIVPICNLKSVVDLGELLPPVPVSNFLKVGGGGGVAPVTLSPVSVGVITLQSGPGSEWIIFRWSKTA
jgi:hypothetical protein